MPPGTPVGVNGDSMNVFGEVLMDGLVDVLVDVLVDEGVDDVAGPHPAQHLWNIDQSPHNFVLKASSNSSSRLDVFFFFFVTPAAVDRLLP